MQKRIIGKAIMYLGDNMEIMPCLSPVDAVITDPPYGIGIDGNWYANPDRWSAPVKKDYGLVEWDQSPATPEQIAAIRAISKHQVIFGGNYFDLPPSQCWLIWDKEATGNFADCEMAWTNLNKPVRLIRWLWNGFKKRHPEERFHPTQKPEAVMSWCIEQAGKPATILDPFAGSGTTGVAAVKMGLNFIGIEKEKAYFEAACLRIEQAQQQQLLAF